VEPTPGLPAGPLLIVVVRCTQCPPVQATLVVCGDCGQALTSIFDAPFDPANSAVADHLTLIHDAIVALAHRARPGEAA
jgi:hypothetical protein